MKAEKVVGFAGAVEALVGHMWKTVVSHYRKGHRLRLEVNDEDQTLWCVFCHVPIVSGSDSVMIRCAEKMNEAGIEFEVMISTLYPEQ